ncbi:MAG: sulfurtransferase TusA family protein [Vampirovibrionales bacterium]|nr:sulfurtransferase TusA family protein [Vampirovibrionales bacterium]
MNPSLPTPITTLDLRTTKCPLNFVQTCLALDKLADGEVMTVLIRNDGPSALNIPNSLAKEGHAVIHTEVVEGHFLRLWVQRGAAKQP